MTRTDKQRIKVTAIVNFLCGRHLKRPIVVLVTAEGDRVK